MFEFPPLWMLPIRTISNINMAYCHVAMVDTLLRPRFQIRHLRWILTLVLTIIPFTFSIALTPTIRVIYNAVLYMGTAMIFYRGHFVLRLFAYVLWIAFLSCAEVIAMTILGSFGWVMDELTSVSQLVMDCSCSFCMLILYRIFHGAVRIVEDRLDGKLWWKLIFIALGVFGLTSIIVLHSYLGTGTDPGSWISKNISIFSAFSMILAPLTMLGIFSLIHQLNGTIRESEEARFAEQQAKIQLNQNQVMISKDAEYRRLRHDIKNHLLAIDSLGQRKEYERQHEYLTSLYAAFENTQVRRYCGHPLIDGILGAKDIQMENCEIEAVWNISPVPEVLPISDLDLCALIGNLIDNAIEACERMDKDAERRVEVALRCSDQGLIFRVVNTSDDVESHLKSGMRSSKEPNRTGVGLRSVRRIVDAYNGEMLLQPSADGRCLEASVYLPIQNLTMK